MPRYGASQGPSRDSGKRAKPLWCQWTCQSNLFPSARGQRPGDGAFPSNISNTTGVPVLCLQLFHLCTFYSSVSLFIFLHYLPLFLFYLITSSTPSHRLLNSALLRDVHMLFWRLHPALLSLRARVGGKSGFVVYSCISFACPWAQLDEMCFA